MGANVWVVVVHLEHPASCFSRRIEDRRHRNAVERSAAQKDEFLGNFKSALSIGRRSRRDLNQGDY